MNSTKTNIIASATGIPEKAVCNTISLLEGGATIPFISRYRKEATGGLDEVQIQSIAEKNATLTELIKRKEFIKKAFLIGLNIGIYLTHGLLLNYYKQQQR